jgi:hypothetical protein
MKQGRDPIEWQLEKAQPKPKKADSNPHVENPIGATNN